MMWVGSTVRSLLMVGLVRFSRKKAYTHIHTHIKNRFMLTCLQVSMREWGGGGL